MFDLLAHLLIVLLAPPLLLGVITRVKANFAGRVGAPLLQPWYDILRLLRKGSVFSTTTTWVFRIGPIIVLAASTVAALLIPLGNHAAPVSFSGDLILFAYLFGLARFFLAAAALDTGSAFEGMGAAREITFACLAESALFFGLLVLAKLSGSLRLAEMLRSVTWAGGGASILLVLVSWFLVLLVENSRIPFDDPNTHLELTMVHEVMVLDHSGPLFGLILYGAAMKLFVFAAVVSRLAFPFASGLALVDWLLFGVGVLLVAVVIGIVESVTARLRLPLIPGLLAAATVLSGFGLVLLLSRS